MVPSLNRSPRGTQTPEAGESRLCPAHISVMFREVHFIDFPSAVRSCEAPTDLWVLTPDLLIYSLTRRRRAAEKGQGETASKGSAGDLCKGKTLHFTTCILGSFSYVLFLCCLFTLASELKNVDRRGSKGTKPPRCQTSPGDAKPSTATGNRS